MFEALLQPDFWVQLLTLTLLEIVLGVDNVIFIAILADRLPAEQKKKAYRYGLMGALVTRVLLLFTLSWIAGLTKPWFYIATFPVSGRAMVLILGGLFLIWKSAQEVYEKVEKHDEVQVKGWGRTLMGTIFQIMLLDIVFSLDSVITAVGMSNRLSVMVTAIVIAIGVMIFFAQPIGDFINRNASLKIIALAFLLMIGVMLVAEGSGQHFPRGYLYFGMLFSVGVELLNMRYHKKKAETVKKKNKSEPADENAEK